METIAYSVYNSVMNQKQDLERDNAALTIQLDVLQAERQELRRLLHRNYPPTVGTVIAEFDPQPNILDAVRNLKSERDALLAAVRELLAPTDGMSARRYEEICKLAADAKLSNQ